jgi:hypothetical protein
LHDLVKSKTKDGVITKEDLKDIHRQSHQYFLQHNLDMKDTLGEQLDDFLLIEKDLTTIEVNSVFEQLKEFNGDLTNGRGRLESKGNTLLDDWNPVIDITKPAQSSKIIPKILVNGKEISPYDDGSSFTGSPYLEGLILEQSTDQTFDDNRSSTFEENDLIDPSNSINYSKLTAYDFKKG